jgi:hypothetical protein
MACFTSNAHVLKPVVQGSVFPKCFRIRCVIWVQIIFFISSWSQVSLMSQALTSTVEHVNRRWLFCVRLKHCLPWFVTLNESSTLITYPCNMQFVVYFLLCKTGGPFPLLFFSAVSVITLHTYGQWAELTSSLLHTKQDKITWLQEKYKMLIMVLKKRIYSVCIIIRRVNILIIFFKDFY